jgi:CubicO group peptidase (beta-lactamase class C family)
MRKKHFLTLLVFPLLALLPAHAFSQPDRRELHEELDRLVSASTEGKDHPEYRNAVVLLDSPPHSFTYRGASGFAQAGTPMTPDHQFYIESITKTFTATIALQLAEEGRLGTSSCVTGPG